MTEAIQETAQYMLATMLEATPAIILVPAPRPAFSGHMIRLSQNPKWYRELYADTPNIRRDRTIASLKRLSLGTCRTSTDQLLIEVAQDILHEWMNSHYTYMKSHGA